MLGARVPVAGDESSVVGAVVVSMIAGLELGHHGSGSQVVTFLLFWEGAGFLTIRRRWVGL